MDTPTEKAPDLTRRRRPDPAGPDTELDAALAAAVHRAGASAGAVFLLDRDPVLVMAVAYGLPSGLTAAWRRIPLTSPLPVCDAVLQDRFVWVGSQEDLARSYSRIAVALPYRLALAAAPLSGTRRVWGALLLIFPADHPEHATPRERKDITTRARLLARLLDDAERPPALMGQVRTAVHAHATAGAAPDQVLTRTNRLLADLDPGLLVSCLYAQLDLTRRQATIASAGHPPPLLRRPTGRGHVLTVESGPLLGVDTTAAYPLTTLPLPDRTLLALYTDGLVEVPGTDASRNAAELAGLLTHSRAATPDRLIDGLVHHTWPTGRHTDDIALLVLDVAPP
ncbi:PP2C family protein-serine/threonine phosphatase [Kitasatospora sp. KL5]|uniref:PP2C family protein-serine/threonine phosphatase n=1 Tax=Kitasatospora sp. KL5 TaxID=3425125 RepID=UPI003D6E955D